MKFIGIIACVFIGIAGPALAASHAEVPDEVIEQCKAEVSASEMPECLKHGALAFEMFDVYMREDVFGDVGGRVIENCAEKNEDYATIMHCVRGAIHNAVETRDLIGIDKIDDVCVAALAAPEGAQIAMSEYRTRKSEWFDDFDYVSTMHYSFPGCADEEKYVNAEENVSVNEGEVVATLGATPNPKDKGHETRSSEDLTQAECALLKEVEGIIEKSSEDELRAMAEELDEFDGELWEGAKLAGLSKEAIETLKTYDPENGIRDVFIVAALLNKNHPALWAELSEDDMVEVGPESEGVDEEMAEAFMQAIFRGAEETYREGCDAG